MMYVHVSMYVCVGVHVLYIQYASKIFSIPFKLIAV